MPTLIVFPSDQWMTESPFKQLIDVNGKTKELYDYQTALKNSRDMKSAIDAVQKALEERKFMAEDLAALLEGFDDESAMELAKTADGEGNETSMVDELLQQAKPDIKVLLDFAVEPFGRTKNIRYSIKAVDAYSKEQVALIEEKIIPNTMDPVGFALRKHIAVNCDDFCDQLVNYYLDLRENGRKINVYFHVADGTDINFIKDEIGEDEDTYADFLVNYIKNKAVGKVAKKGRQTSKLVEIKNVRIPFFNEDGDPLEADDWAKDIRKVFKSETGIKVSKEAGNGLGVVNFQVGTE